MNIFLSPSNIY